MPYVLSSNAQGALKQRRSNPFTGVVSAQSVAYTSHDDVYSFRTGLSAKFADLSNEERYIPPGDNIVSDLVYRRKYIDRQISILLTGPANSPQPSSYLLGDVGHEFGVSHIRASISPVTMSRQGSWQPDFRLEGAVPQSWPVRDSSGNVSMSVSSVGDPAGFFNSRAKLLRYNLNSVGQSESDLKASGTTALRQMSPFKSSAGLLGSLLELVRGDVPGILANLRKHMITIQALKASGVKSASQALGSEYLNVVFGWTPIIRDVQAAIDVLIGIDNILFPSDSTRRKYRRDLYDAHSSFQTSVSFGDFAPLAMGSEKDAYSVDMSSSFGSSLSVGGMTCTASLSETASVWTTARFATGATPSSANNGFLDRAIDLLGLNLTPEVLWELTPWSWLLDWFTNIGDIVEDLTNFGLSNTILNYAYSTLRRKTLMTIGADPQSWLVQDSQNRISGSPNYALSVDQKVRIAASPFGFGTSLSSLTSGQWAILVALGLARAR